MSWSATDPAGGADVREMDVDYAVDEGAWTGWFTDTQAVSGTLAGQAGHAYTFRVRATDHVSNTGAWAQTTVTTTLTRKYYYLAGQRVAMRSNDVVYWLHGDHLGSTSLTTDQNGAVVAEQRYEPYGEPRWVSGTLPTEFTYTGQRAEGFGLMDYHARYYSPRLGRFISPDTIVPGTGSASLNRYLYVNANPVRYRDPSGHYIDMGDGLGLRDADDGSYRVVHGGSVFPNPVAKDIANGLLSGEAHYWDRLPTDSWRANIQEVGDYVADELDWAFGLKPRGYRGLSPSIVYASAPSMVKTLNSWMDGSYSSVQVPSNLWQDAVGGHDCVGCGYQSPTPINSRGWVYPYVKVEDYGAVPYPTGSTNTTDPNPLRAEYTPALRQEFRTWWHDRYGWYPDPSQYQIHHVQPLSRGGTNDFANLIPLRTGEHQLFTNWWRYYP